MLPNIVLVLPIYYLVLNWARLYHIPQMKMDMCLLNNFIINNKFISLGAADCVATIYMSCVVVKNTM